MATRTKILIPNMNPRLAAKNRGRSESEMTDPDMVMMTPKTVHAVASSADRFQVICGPRSTISGLVRRKPARAGMVNPSVPRTWTCCPILRLAPSMTRPSTTTMSRDMGHEGAEKRYFVSRSILSSLLFTAMSILPGLEGVRPKKMWFYPGESHSISDPQDSSRAHPGRRERSRGPPRTYDYF